jgi:hypothetical protein
VSDSLLNPHLFLPLLKNSFSSPQIRLVPHSLCSKGSTQRSTSCVRRNTAIVLARTVPLQQVRSNSNKSDMVCGTPPLSLWKKFPTHEEADRGSTPRIRIRWVLVFFSQLAEIDYLSGDSGGP